MNATLIKLFMLLSTFAQLLPGVQMPGNGVPPTADPSAAPTMKVRVVAFQALNAPDKKIDPELKPLSKLLKELPYDTFRFVNDVQQDATAMIETKLVVNALYTFNATMLGADDKGATQVAARIEMFDGTKRVNALSAEGSVTPGKWLVFRGLPINQGEMVMLMTLVQDPGQDSSESKEQEQDEEQQEKQDQEKQNAKSGEEKEGENQQEGEEEQQEGEKDEQEGEQKEGEDSSESQEEGEGEGENEGEAEQQEAQESEGGEAKDGEAMDKPEIESLLESLEEIDRREQIQQRQPKGRPFFPKSGEWW